MTKEELLAEIYKAMPSTSHYINKGKFVFEYIEKKYGNVAREVEFIDKVNCTYADNKIEEFIECVIRRAYNKICQENTLVNDMLNSSLGNKLKFVKKYLDGKYYVAMQPPFEYYNTYRVFEKDKFYIVDNYAHTQWSSRVIDTLDNYILVNFDKIVQCNETD
jgi:hypothetical protein